MSQPRASARSGFWCIGSWAAHAGVALLFNVLMVLVAMLAIVMTIPKARQQPASAVRS